MTPAERQRLMFLDGITKSLGASNIRNCHLIADESVIKFIVARASHTVMPSFYSLAVAMATRGSCQTSSVAEAESHATTRNKQRVRTRSGPPPAGLC